jgi:hypothetical protein
MPSTERKRELKARHRWLRPSHSRLCINRPSEISRLTDGCVGQGVNEQYLHTVTSAVQIFADVIVRKYCPLIMRPDDGYFG